MKLRSKVTCQHFRNKKKTRSYTYKVIFFPRGTAKGGELNLVLRRGGTHEGGGTPSALRRGGELAKGGGNS